MLEKRYLYKESKQQSSWNVHILLRNVSCGQICLMAFALTLCLFYSQAASFYALYVNKMLESMQDYILNMHKFAYAVQALSIKSYYLAIASFITQTIGTTIFIIIGKKSADKWKIRYFESLLKQKVEFFDQNSASSMSSDIENYGSVIEDSIGLKMSLGFYLLFWIIGSFVLGFYSYNQMFYIWLGMLPIIWGLFLLAYYMGRKAIHMRQAAYSKAAEISEESFDGIKTIVAFNQQDKVIQNYSNNLQLEQSVNNKLSTMQGCSWALTNAIMIAVSGYCFYLQQEQITEREKNWATGDRIEFDDFAFFSTSLIVGIQNAGMLIPIIHSLLNSVQCANKMSSVIDNPGEQYKQGIQTPGINGHIEFCNVSFGYPGQLSLALRNINLNIMPGQHIGIVGQTGSGKSTLAQLVERFYKPDQGLIKLDGIDIQQIDLKYYRSQIVYVSQEPILFADSIKQNIIQGQNISEEQMVNAAQKALALDFINQLPQKFETQVGVKGGGLSGGQKQRVALARAFTRNCKVVILDEATSALDNKTESVVISNLQSNFSECSMISIAQRISTVRQSDQIVVLEQGCIVEQGTHSQLIESKGKYAIYASLQNYYTELDQIEIIEETQVVEQVQSEDDDLKQEETTINQYKTLYSILIKLRKYTGLILISFIMAAISGGVFTTVGYYTAQNLYHMAQNYNRRLIIIHNSWYFSGSALVLLISFSLLFMITSYIGSCFSQDLRKTCISSLMYKDLDYFDTNHTGELSGKLGNDCRQASNLGGTVMSVNLLGVSSVIISVAFAWRYDSTLSLIFLGCAPIIVIILIATEHLKNTQNIDRSLEYIVSDSLTNIKTVKSQQLETLFVQQYQSQILQQNRFLYSRSLLKGITIGALTSFTIATHATIDIVGSRKVENGDLTRQDFLIVAIVLIASSWVYYIVGPVLSDTVLSMNALKRLIRIFEQSPKIDCKSKIGQKDIIIGEIDFSDVKFQYPSRNVMVLNGLNFSVPQGSSLGICGTTGSGKTTISQLLLRFYDVTAGSIKIDGINIQDFNIKHLRQHISWVGQEPLLFRGSIKYNLTFDEKHKQQEIEDICERAQCLDFITHKPQTFDEDVGYRGSLLSGGQKQRICISRALLKNSAILILDEATSALDNVTESKIKEFLSRDSRTKITIAHKLNSIQNCDNIIVLELGKIIEQGNHKSLIAKQGVYFQLYNLG